MTEAPAKGAIDTESRGKSKFFLLLLILGAVLLAIVAWRLYQRLGRRPTPAIEQSVAVSVVTARKSDLQRFVKVVGTVQSASASNLAMKAAGRVALVSVRLGQAVEAGDKLVVLDTTDLASQAKAAQAAYELASANLARVLLSSPIMESAQAEASLKQVRAQVSTATKNLERMSNLYQQGAAPLAQLEAAQAQFEVAAAQLELAAKSLEVVQSGTAQQTIAAARAQKKQAEATLELATSQLDTATLRAPFAGTVSFVNINPGEMVGAGVPVIGLVEQGSLVAELMVSEKQVKVINEGQAMTVMIPATGKAVSAFVTGVAPSIDARSRLYRVRAEIRPAPADAKPGMMLEVGVLEDSRKAALVIPEESVVGGSVDTSVYVIVGQRAHKRPVRLGLSDGKLVEVLSGINEGDIVVRKGQTFLREGILVKIVDRGDG